MRRPLCVYHNVYRSSALLLYLLLPPVVTPFCGCRSDDYTDNPPYYASPSTASGTSTAWSPVNTTRTGAPLWAPQPTTGTTTTTPVTTGVVNAGGTSTPTVAAPAGVPAGYTAYTCVPTRVLMSNGRGGYTTGTVQLLQPVGVVGSPGNIGTTTGGMAQSTYHGTAYNNATVQPLADYPDYGTIQTPGGIAVVAIPSTGSSVGMTTASAAGAYGTTVGTGTSLVAPVPAGQNDPGTGNHTSALTPPPTFADHQTESTNSGYSLPSFPNAAPSLVAQTPAAQNSSRTTNTVNPTSATTTPPTGTTATIPTPPTLF
ncbi:MAG: hypothetical protein Q4C47_00670 [Planctomycetia bacterium]|nr:hypothetical protein [Planctomycetia bacterium]